MSRTSSIRLSGRRQRLLVALVAAGLLGAMAFGLWHLAYGGLVNGNPRAGTFGLVLALAAGVPLGIGVAFRRRLLGPP